MKHILKLALPVIVIIALGGLVISSMQNPNPVVVVATIGLATIVLFSRMRKIRKNAKKHYKKATKSSSSGSRSARSASGGMTPQQAQALQNQLNAIARSASGVERLTAHADMRITVTSRGDGSFNIDTDIIRDGHEESYSPAVDSAAQVVLNNLEYQLSDAVARLR